jgi:hypothetical protein
MKPKPGHVWKYQDKSWVEVPIEKLDRSIPAFEGPIVGFSGKIYKVIDGNYFLPDSVTSHDAVQEYFSRTSYMEHDLDSISWSAIRFYEDVLMWRAFGEDQEVFDSLDSEEVDRLKQSFEYIRGIDPEELTLVVMIAIQEMKF